MKHPKLLISIVVIAMLSGLFLAAAYNNLSSNGFQVNLSEQTPQLRIISPEENGTYQTIYVPLNVTANNATAKITYSLDSGENITLTEFSNTLPCLTYGVHNITVYGFNSEGKVGDIKNIAFTVANSAEKIPQHPQIQIFSPQQNATYNTTKVRVPLNITANSATAKITYSLDDGKNITLTETNTTLPRLTYGVHSITVYGFDSEGKVGDIKVITFTLVYPWAPPLKLTMQQVQETINYFEARGLKVQVLDTSKPQNCLYADSIDVESKEALVDCAISRGITVIYEVLDLNTNYVAFCANYYDIPTLPTVYKYSATLSSTS